MCVGVALQTSAVNVPMFIGARFCSQWFLFISMNCYADAQLLCHSHTVGTGLSFCQNASPLLLIELSYPTQVLSSSISFFSDSKIIHVSLSETSEGALRPCSTHVGILEASSLPGYASGRLNVREVAHGRWRVPTVVQAITSGDTNYNCVVYAGVASLACLQG